MPTEFKEKVLNKKKIHTIRANFPLWEKRIKEVQEGRAVLSIRQWTGEPYRSKQVEIVRLAAEGGVGVQKLCFPNRLTAWIDYPERRLSVDFKCLAKKRRTFPRRLVRLVQALRPIKAYGNNQLYKIQILI